MASFTVIYDACVLYPASVRDLLIEIARTGLVRAKWTARIHIEWIDALLRARPDLVRARLEHAARLMDGAVLDCLLTGFEPLEAALESLPDAGDRHVWPRRFTVVPRRSSPLICATFRTRYFVRTEFEPFIRTNSPNTYST